MGGGRGPSEGISEVETELGGHPLPHFTNFLCQTRNQTNPEYVVRTSEEKTPSL